MSNRQALTVNFDYQARALEFSVGDWVTPIGADNTDLGRVLAVWPGIGVVDVEWGTGYRRMNVEDIAIASKQNPITPPKHVEDIPGGRPVRSGRGPNPDRVARAWVKSAIYWAERDRGYRATRGECEGKTYNCPKKCLTDEGDPVSLRRAIYKREDGKSIKLLACPNCMFLIRVNDVRGHHHNIEVEQEV